jgi:hypothetical protein
MDTVLGIQYDGGGMCKRMFIYVYLLLIFLLEWMFERMLTPFLLLHAYLNKQFSWPLIK